MLVSSVDLVQYTSQESYRGIQLLHKHWKPIPNSKKPQQNNKTLQFSEDGFLPVERFSPHIILRIPWLNVAGPGSKKMDWVVFLLWCF